ncbi:MAG: hypothetical protein COA88_12765 [Kordia sp.]|nr:MAG: hypothetical protein COA88_12765 [Kordia sp.]
MRIFKYWIEHSKDLYLGNTKQTSKVFGGSNISSNDAIKDAEIKLLKAQKIINGELKKDEDYEADIIEEIIEIIDDDNIVTRNRYGALVLNSKRLMFIDIDDYSRTLFEIIFKKNTHIKELLLKRIEKTANKGKYSELGFRVYETFKGYRVLITNKEFNPRSKESKKIMSDFNSDYLYRWLCIKQNCYRARLTPKPYRMKHKAIRVVYPNRTEIQQKDHLNWVKLYDHNSQQFSSCNLVKEFGKTRTNRAIEYHDRLTGISNHLKLA